MTSIINSIRTKVPVALVVLLLALPLSNVSVGYAQQAEEAQVTEEVLYFPETDRVVAGKLLDHWREHGGLAQQGFPISDEFTETSDTDGKPYAVQYFEKGVLENHPENPPPYDVEGALLGSHAYTDKYPEGAPGQTASADNPALFNETGKAVGGEFRNYWEDHGGVMALGYPVSDEFEETSEADGKTRKVQYFERAVLEDHPDEPTPHNVQVANLGAQEYGSKYAQTSTPMAATVPKPPVAGCKSHLTPGVWNGPMLWDGVARGTGINGTGFFSATMQLNIACDGSFTGTATADKFTAEAKAGPLRLASCSATETPVLDFTKGKVVTRADGLHLAVTESSWKQGTLTCRGPAVSDPDVELAGKVVKPFDIPIETMSEGKIGGSTRFLNQPVADLLNEGLASARPGAKVEVTGTGRWELVLQK